MVAGNRITDEIPDVEKIKMVTESLFDSVAAFQSGQAGRLNLSAVIYGRWSNSAAPSDWMNFQRASQPPSTFMIVPFM
jgi:hypothetical protein